MANFEFALKGYGSDLSKLPFCITRLCVVSTLVQSGNFAADLARLTHQAVQAMLPHCSIPEWQQLMEHMVQRQVSKILHAKCEKEELVKVLQAAVAMNIQKIQVTMKNLLVVLHPKNNAAAEVVAALADVSAKKDTDTMCMAMWFWPGGQALLAQSQEVAKQLIT